MIWPRSVFLLREPRLTQVVERLKEFLNDKGERLVREPEKRAVLQHDLWGVFDWIQNHYLGAAEELVEFEKLLVRVMRRVSLQSEELLQLKSNYLVAIESGRFPRQPNLDGNAVYYLPSEVLASESDWICVGADELIATDHVHHLDGRSVTLVWSKNSAEL